MLVQRAMSDDSRPPGHTAAPHRARALVLDGSLPRHEEAKDHRLEHLLGRRVDGGSREETVLPVALDSRRGSGKCNHLRFRVVFRLLFVLLLFVSRCFVFYVIRFHFFKEERGHGESGRLGATRAGSDPPVVILISIMRTKLSTSPPLSP